MKQRETFQSPYKQYQEHIGKPFKLIGEVEPLDKEVGKQYRVKLSTGETIIAWPEEVYSGTGWEPAIKK